MDDQAEPPCYQPNQWGLLPSLRARLLVLDGADPRALQAATELLLVSRRRQHAPGSMHECMPE